jgi:hypothetical protein
MASIASLINRFVGLAELAETARPAVWTRAGSSRLRPIANEDVYLYVKRIDNSSVVRAIDPAARRTRTRTVVTGFAAAILIIAGLVPSAYNIMAGFTLQNLEKDNAKLHESMVALEVREAELLSPARLEKLAKTLQLSEPIASQVQYLDGKATHDAKLLTPDSH